MIERDEAEDTIKAAAKAKNPNLYFEIKDVDLFAKEFKTHVHCYRQLTRGFNKSSKASVNDQNQSDNVSTTFSRWPIFFASIQPHLKIQNYFKLL